MHCALVEAMGTQTDKQKSSNKPMRDIINKVRKEAERLNKSGPKTNTFQKIRHVYSEQNRPDLTEADLVGSLKAETTDTRQRLRRAVAKRFLQEDYAVKKPNHTRDYTIDICMYLCPISFQGMHRSGSHMQIFLDAHDNQTKHEYYTAQEILDGEKRIKEMMRTTHKNRTDRERKEKESSVDPVAKKQKQQKVFDTHAPRNVIPPVHPASI